MIDELAHAAGVDAGWISAEVFFDLCEQMLRDEATVKVWRKLEIDRQLRSERNAAGGRGGRGEAKRRHR